MLSKRHWELFEDDSKLKPKKNKNLRSRSQNKQFLNLDDYGFENI